MRGDRILLAVLDFPPLLGGESTLYHGLARHLPAARTLVFAPRARGDDAVDALLPVEVVRGALPAHGGTASRAARAALSFVHLARLLLNRRVGYLVCGQLLSLGVPTRILARLAGIPYAVVVHGADLLDYHDRPPWGRLTRFVVEGADAIVTNSASTRALVERLLPGAARRALVLPMGVDVATPGEAGDASGGEAVRRRHLLGQGPVLLTVARLVASKGHDVVIAALPRLLRGAPGLRYLVVGTGPTRAALEAQARALGVAESVVFAGRVPSSELPSYYGAATLYVQLSRETGEYDGLEGFGLAFLEAAAQGVAAIGGRTGGVPEAIVDGRTGLLVEPRDRDGFADAALRLLRDPARRAVMGAEARLWARAHSWERSAEALRALWEAA